MVLDEQLFYFINQFAGQNNKFDAIVSTVRLDTFKSVPFLMLFWGLWFADDRQPQVRQQLVAVLIALIPVILVARLLAVNLPFRLRPIHDPSIDSNLIAGSSRVELDGWSSMPSDHAAIFFAFALGLFIINRRAGIVAFLLATFVVSLPRVLTALHWPSDILAGAAVGILVMAVIFYPVNGIVHRIAIVPYFEKRPRLGYPILFFATFEVARMFDFTRHVVNTLL